LKKYAYLEKVFPHYHISGAGDEFIVLEDTSNKNPIPVVLSVKRNGHIECMHHKTTDCDHVKFLTMSPDVNNILYPGELEVGDLEDPHKDDGSRRKKERKNNNKEMLVIA
jgi:hypothetical protein